ncbi:siderophore-interacting protein [Nonomuraea typhae]|uniref:siderophore-interacting protein n=1 Tax=Nonomuraea typhae TaxID=2603600 RepID=UPI0012FA1584|nr:siderophore-interacting protein [Nonomuraea typhae]
MPKNEHKATVLRTEQLTPHMIRVVAGGESLRGFATSGLTDHYVKLVFRHEGVEYPEPFTVQSCRELLPREQWPRVRTYTVRAWDPDTLELTIDFVYHGDEGVAGPWAAAAKPGDTLYMLGPGGGYAPDPEAAWHLLAGDESALPAIAAALEALPEDATAHVFVEIEGPAEEQKTPRPVTWLYRGDRPVGELLVEAVRGLEFPEGDVHAFVHGEAGFVKQLRRHLRIERGIPLERLSISGYWRLGADDEAWRAVKKEWNQAVEAEEATALSS